MRLLPSCVSMFFLSANAAYSQEAITIPLAPPSNWDKKFSIDVAFPGGGSVTGTNTLGGRFFINNQVALGIYPQVSFDKERNFMGAGATSKLFVNIAEKDRTIAYISAQISAGQNKNTVSGTTTPNTNTSDTNSSTTEITTLQASTGASIGLEIFLLPEISTSVEIGLGGSFLPKEHITFATGTSQIALHYFF